MNKSLFDIQDIMMNLLEYNIDEDGVLVETEEEFNKTYEFLKDINFYQMHIFKYSPRKGTKAAVMRWSNRWKSKRRKKCKIDRII